MQTAAENDGIAAKGKYVFLVRLRDLEIFISRAERIVFFVCEVFKGYFSFVFPAPCPRCVNGCVSDNDFAKGMESVLDMFPVFSSVQVMENPPFLHKGLWLVGRFFL